jgi:hypothetical protein
VIFERYVQNIIIHISVGAQNEFMLESCLFYLGLSCLKRNKITMPMRFEAFTSVNIYSPVFLVTAPGISVSQEPTSSIFKPENSVIKISTYRLIYLSPK